MEVPRAGLSDAVYQTIRVRVRAGGSGKNGLKGMGVDKARIYYIVEPTQPGLTRVSQFHDCTKKPIHEALTQNPPSSSFNVFLGAVGYAYFPLFTHSGAYLIPNWIRISVGLIPDGFGETWSLYWNAYIRPGWACGTNHRFECVPTTLARFPLYQVGASCSTGYSG